MVAEEGEETLRVSVIRVAAVLIAITPKSACKSYSSFRLVQRSAYLKVAIFPSGRASWPLPRLSVAAEGLNLCSIRFRLLALLYGHSEVEKVRSFAHVGYTVLILISYLPGKPLQLDRVV